MLRSMRNMLTLIEKRGHKGLYRCECGVEAIKSNFNVERNVTRSCGCLSRKWKDSGNANRSHGRSKTPEYWVWTSMKQRCHDPKCKSFERYGAKGVTVCDRWRNSFENFLEDMGERPSPSHSIDRVECSKGYTPENCRWATAVTQANNKPSVDKIQTPKGMLSVSEAAREFGLKRTTLRNRLYAGWTVERALGL